MCGEALLQGVTLPLPPSSLTAVVGFSVLLVVFMSVPFAMLVIGKICCMLLSS